MAKTNKDYIIFDQAPTITFTCNEPIHDWYMGASHYSEKPRINGTITTSNCKADFILLGIPAEIRIRGNYTADYSKKPFQIKFAEKENLFGLNNGNSHKKWILLTEYTGGDMLRNATAFYMAQQIYKDTNVWVPTFTYAHFYIQDTENLYYMGLFLLTDQKEQAKKRVNVFEPEDGYEGTDIGYFFERDDYYQASDDPTFMLWDNAFFGRDFKPVGPIKTKHESNNWARQRDGIKLYGDGFSIKNKITNDAQVTYLKERVKKVYEVMYRAIYNAEYYEINENNELVPSELTTTQEVLSKTINIKSFVDRYILEELVCNPDLAHSSFYFTLDMSEQGDKLVSLACPWDYDRGYGLTNGFANDPEAAGLWAKECTLGWWISMLANTDWFTDLVKARWQELYDSYFMRKVLNLQDDYCQAYVQDFARNYDEWDIYWGENKTWTVYDDQGKIIIPNDITIHQDFITEADYKAMLQTWVDDRMKTLHQLFDGQGSTDWPEPPDPPDPPGPEPPEPGDASIFRKDKLVKHYTEETWNQMYNNAAKHADELTKLWNMIYSSKSNKAVLFYNKMYMAVASGKSLSDPDLQAELRAWNAQAAR